MVRRNIELQSTNPETGETETRTVVVNVDRNVRGLPDHSSDDAAVRMVTSDMLEISQPIIDFYDLCSYSVEFCE